MVMPSLTPMALERIAFERASTDRYTVWPGSRRCSSRSKVCSTRVVIVQGTMSSKPGAVPHATRYYLIPALCDHDQRACRYRLSVVVSPSSFTTGRVGSAFGSAGLDE